jgi:pimeloyl-ACP methyl ester carboxylesterase
MQLKNIIINNLNIRYYQSDVFNKNNALVYLHGWGSEAGHFKNILEKCGSFIAPDLPGFGGSSMPAGDWLLGDYADFLEKFLKKLGVENPTLAGHSFGGSVIVKYCARGGQTKKIILIDSAGIRQKSLRIYLYMLIAKTGKIFFSLPGLSLIQDKVRKKFHKVIDANDFSNLTAGTLKETFKNILEEDLRSEMEKINAETVIIWGKNDLTTPLNEGLIINKTIKNSHFFVIKNAGHYPFLDNEKEFTEVFLSEIK